MKSASMISATLGDRIGRRRLLLSVRPATGDERPEALISLDVQDLRSDVVLIDVEVHWLVIVVENDAPDSAQSIASLRSMTASVEYDRRSWWEPRCPRAYALRRCSPLSRW
jgi:hypothetical protein